MAELHIIGQLVGATAFPQSELTCKFKVVSGEDWSLLEGETEGQTQVDLPQDGEHCVWNHPLDLHFSTKSLKGWPKIMLEVYHVDRYGRSELYGYGFAHVPTSAGHHAVECVAWRPVGSFKDRLLSYFLGVNPKLRYPQLVYEGTDRFRLNTESMGKVHLSVTVLMKGFEQYGVSW